MNFMRTEIEDLIVIEPKVYTDDRGYFYENYKKRELESYLGYAVNFIQGNESKSTFGVLRGLHFQAPPYAQTKLVRVIQGSVLDVAVDIRKGSKTYGQHVATELSEYNKRQLFIPKGFAHGFVVLSDEAIFSYQVDNYYNKESEGGILFNSSELNVNWQIETKNLKLSPKDKILPNFKDFTSPFSITEQYYESF